MKLTLQILGIIVVLGLLGAANVWHNNYKHEKCVEMGGRFVINTTDSHRSICVLGN